MKKEIILTDESLESMAAMGLTDKEICHLTGLTQNQWRTNYKDILARGRARLAQSLRKAQIASALKGNASLLIWLGKVYLNQKEAIDHSLTAEHRAISITPNVLERLQTSYRLTMEQVRQRGTLPAAPQGGEAGGVPGDRDGVLKTVPLNGNSGITSDEEVEK